MKTIKILLICLAGVALYMHCGNYADPTDSDILGPGPGSTPQPAGLGADSLESLCQDGACEVDTGAGYTRTGNTVTVRPETGDTTGTTLIFTEVNDSQAVASLDTSVIDPGMGTVKLVFERETGSGNSLENELWRLDSIRISSDSLGIDASIPVPIEARIVLDSTSGDVLTTVDTTGMTEELLVALIAGCPFPVLQAATSQGGLAGLLLPVDSVDASRSSCDTTWGYKLGRKVYVTSNGTDSLFVHNASTRQQTSAIDLSVLVPLILPLVEGLIAPQ
jgi:hypothetical protein